MADAGGGGRTPVGSPADGRRRVAGSDQDRSAAQTVSSRRVDGAVAGFPDTDDLLGVSEGDLDGPSRGVAFDDLLGGGGRIGGDQGQFGMAGFADDDDPYGAGAEHAVTQAPLFMDVDGSWCGRSGSPWSVGPEWWL